MAISSSFNDEYTMRLQMDIESSNPDVDPRIMVYPKLKIGPQIRFQSYGNSADTELVLRYDTEVDESVIPCITNRIHKSGRSFMGINLYALMEPFHESGSVSFEITPDKMEHLSCSINAIHPGHMVDADGTWAMTVAAGLAWCKGVGVCK